MSLDVSVIFSDIKCSAQENLRGGLAQLSRNQMLCIIEIGLPEQANRDRPSPPRLALKGEPAKLVVVEWGGVVGGANYLQASVLYHAQLKFSKFVRTNHHL